MYKSVSVFTYMGPDAIYAQGNASLSTTTGQPQAYVKNATANVVNGAEYVIVNPPQSPSSSSPSGGSLVTGNQYRIVGEGGLNLVAVYVGQAPDSSGNATGAFRFKVGN